MRGARSVPRGDAIVVLVVIIIAGGVAALIGVLSSAGEHPNTVTLGLRSSAWGGWQPYTVPRNLRLQHFVLYGATGSGKSTQIESLALQDAQAGYGGIVIDIKDSLALSIAARLPPARVERTLLFSPADAAYPPAFNPLAAVPPGLRTLAASELLSAFKRLAGDAWGPRLEHVLRNSLLTLLEVPGATLLDIVRLLTEPTYRDAVTPRVRNFMVRQFWAREWPGIVGTRGSLANVESLLNKLGVFAYPEIRNCIGQQQRGLDVFTAAEQGDLILAHLPEGQLGPDASHFLAALLVAHVQLAAHRRVAIAAAQRTPWYAFFDEAQNYQHSALDKLITEGRGFGVGCVVASQFKEQLPTTLRLALEKNCPYQLTTKQLNGGHLVELFKLQEPEALDATTVLAACRPPAVANPTQLETIRTRSRTLLARPRAEVERAIEQRMTGQTAAARGHQPPTPRVLPFPARPGEPPLRVRPRQNPTVRPGGYLE